MPLSREEQELAQHFPLITAKKVIYVANTDEKGTSRSALDKVCELARQKNSAVIPICAKLEEELLGLTEREAQEYLTALGMEETGPSRVIKIGFHEPGLITFLTTGEKETRA